MADTEGADVIVAGFVAEDTAAFVMLAVSVGIDVIFGALAPPPVFPAHMLGRLSQTE